MSEPDRIRLDDETQGVPIEVNDGPQLRLPERYGVFLWWPEAGTDWIYPDDVKTCNTLIPSTRIFHRDTYDDTYLLLTYGTQFIRIKPILWLEVKTDGYEIGDQVEVRSKMGRRKPCIATIREMRWDRQGQRVEYFLRAGDRKLRTRFFVDDIQPAFRLDQPMTLRQREIAAKSRLK